MKYNDNITIVREAEGFNDPLEANEYFALMVTDKHQGAEEDRNFFDKSLGWIGLEHYVYNGKRVYISKNYNQRHKLHRGRTVVISVKDVDLCRVL